MKLDPGTIACIEAELEQARDIAFGEVVIRFVKHEGRFVKVQLERFERRVSQVDATPTNDID